MATKSVATKTVATKAKIVRPNGSAPQANSETPEKDGPETPDAPLPLLDLSDAAVKKMIKSAKKRGYVTYEQLNAVMPSEEVTSEKIEDILAMMNEMGINVVETEENDNEEGESEEAAEEEEPEGGELVEVAPKTPAKSEAKEPAERTDDPVRMYLREMGTVELLSREGEIAIAKRIEAGREAMIAGLCESPLSFQAIIIWRDELNEGKVFLRDIIDLEATYAGPDAKQAPPANPNDPNAAPAINGAPAVNGGFVPQPVQAVSPPSAPPGATPFKPRPVPGAEGEEAGEEAAISDADLDEDDLENSMSLAAIEAELKPKVLETFDKIADAFKRLRRLQEIDIQNKLSSGNDKLSPNQERKYKKLKEEIIAEVKSLRLNQARIDALVEQLYDINKRLVSHEGRLMRLAESHGVPREGFLRQYQGSELDFALAQPGVEAVREGLEEFHRPRQGSHQGVAHPHPRARHGNRARNPGIPQARAHGAEGRARGAPGQERDGRGQSPPRHLDRQEIHQPRPAIPRPDPGRQYRADEGGR